MRNRLLSLLLVAVMLFGMIVSTVSCQMLEEYVGYENLGQDYLDKYYPDRDQANGDNGTEDEGNNGGNTGFQGNHDPDIKPEEGYNLITFFWNNSRAVVSKCDLWAWYDGDGGDGKGYIWKPCSYGYYVTLKVPADVAEVGFIPRKDCTDPGGTSWGFANKDCGPDDLFATIEGKDTFIYLKGGRNDANQYHSFDGGKTLEVIEKFNIAGIIDRNTIEYFVTPATKLTNISQVKVYDGDKEIAVTKVTSLNKAVQSGKVTVNADLDVNKNYTIVIDGFGEKAVVPTKIFDTKWFAENYHYDGTDLGSTINTDGTTTFKVWAPTASKVVLNLYKDGNKKVNSPEDKKFDMTLGEKGVWSYTAPVGHGTFYTYSVTTSVGTQEAVDPYAKSAGVNGDRGMVIDLSLTNPTGWENDTTIGKTNGIKSYSEAIIWEIHIRDFSNLIDFGSKEANEDYQGKYLAFTQEGLVNANGESVGIDYLKKLGVNYVHLLPSYDYATVDESDPDSGFNWGYDPKNYNVPEGSYSSNPNDGVTRVNEYKQMVQALHDAGIGVIMDVVYNHTFDKNASFNRIVPYYYYRYKANGANSSGSGCGNDTASERYMYGKFMVESINYWQTEYHLDGFRFDLMGLHDVDTMQEVEAVVHTNDPQAIIYGEGWQMMVNAYAGAQSAHQGNIYKIQPTNGAIGTIAVFNDTMRVGLKGEADDRSLGYINGKNDEFFRSKVLFGVNGGDYAKSGSWWTTTTDMVVNYLSAHDNSTLWDKLTVTQSDVNTRLAMNRLGATILFTSQGIVFFQAGEEMLRTKPNPKYDTGFDHNSYKSSDEINNLKWDTLDSGNMYSNMVDYYAGLCAMRTGMSIFTDFTSFKITEHTNNLGYNVVIKDSRGGEVIVVVNPHGSAMSFGSVPSGYHIICNGSKAGTTSLGTTNGNVSVPAYSACIYVNTQVLNSVGK